MKAKRSPVASYTWRSILLSRSLLAKGLRVIIGDGRNTNILSDPWVPSLPNFHVLHKGDKPDAAPSMVCQLVTDEGWNKKNMGSGFLCGK